MNIFCAFSLFCFHHGHLLNIYMFVISIWRPLSLFPHLLHLSLIQLLFSFFLQVMVYLVLDLKYQIAFQHILQFLRKCLWFLCRLKSFMYSCRIIWLFLLILVSHIHTEIQAFLFYCIPVLIHLITQVYLWISVFSSFLLLINSPKKKCVVW